MQVLIKHTQRINSSAKVNGGEASLAFVQHTEWAAQRNGLLDGNIIPLPLIRQTFVYTSGLA